MTRFALLATLPTDNPWVMEENLIHLPSTFDDEGQAVCIASSASKLQSVGATLSVAERTGETWDSYRVTFRYRQGERVNPTGHIGSCQAYVTVDESDCTCL